MKHFFITESGKLSVGLPLIMLVLSLTAAFILTGCPQPTDSDPVVSGPSGDPPANDAPALPGNVTISPSSDVTTGTALTASYSGTETVTWQWNKDGTAIESAAAATYTPYEAGSYTATASATGYQSKTSAAVDVTGARIPALPGNVTVSPGSDVTTGTELTASYSGTETVTWQWNKDGTAIESATAATYTPNEVGSYTATASATGYQSKTSAAVAVDLPALPGNVTVSPDSGVTAGTPLTADYDGSETVTWQWNKDGTAIAGETAVTYTPVTEGSYTVTASAAGYNSKTSAAVAVASPSRTDASIKNTFGISAAGTAGVTAAFNAVHAYLQSRTAAQLVSDSFIQRGDYIDLPAITVAGTAVSDAELAGHGRLLRLIVVGINSFNGSFPYTGQDSGANDGNNGAHLVFQFQNIAFRRSMEASDTNANGYLGSAMRAYLVGDFLTGLTGAGVPDSVLWAPARYVANKGSAANGEDTITDKLWLPTEREMFGSRTFSSDTYETAQNQARLEYYDYPTPRIKYNSSNTENQYWTASPYSGNSASFCIVRNVGDSSFFTAGSPGGFAPAFCVK